MYQPAMLEEAALPRPETRGNRFLGRIGAAISSNRKAMLGVLILLGVSAAAVFAPMIAPYSPDSTAFLPTLPPSHAHLLGTTSYGQDVFSQLVWGARSTLLIGLLAGLSATILSTIVGVTSGYLGGITDHVLSMFTDIFLVFPALPLMIIIAAYAKSGGTWTLIAVIAITGWSFGARQLRPQALSLRNREFLEAARVRGESRTYIIVAELLPNMISLLVAIFLGAALYAILAAAGLQFIGLGNPNDLSWGTMLYWGENNEALMSGAPWWILAPGAAIALLGAGVALVNYGVDEIGNPALRGARRRRRFRRGRR